jgi:hypothetical protein
LRHGLAHQVLNDDTERNPSLVCVAGASDGAGEGRHHGDDDVRPVEPPQLPRGGHEERGLVAAPTQDRHGVRDMVPDPVHLDPVDVLQVPRLPVVSLGNLPFGVVRQADDRGDLGPVRGQVLTHGGRVRRDPGDLREVVDPDDDDVQAGEVLGLRSDQP